MSRLGVRLTVSILTLTVSLLCHSGSYGQSVKQVEGIVSSEVGGPVSDAAVILITDDRVWNSKTNRDGEFEFTDFIGPVHYIEVYSPGFFPTRIAVTASTPQSVKVTLRVGSGSQCFPTTVPSADYEERVGKAQLAGSVFDTSDSPLPHAKLVLTRVGLNNRPTTEGPSLAPASTNEKGEFQFEDLEPGRYSLTATHEGFYNTWSVDFWIASKNLTRTTRIRLVPEGGARIPCQYDSLRSIAPEASPPIPAQAVPIVLPFKCPLTFICQQ